MPLIFRLLEIILQSAFVIRAVCRCGIRPQQLRQPGSSEDSKLTILLQSSSPLRPPRLRRQIRHRKRQPPLRHNPPALLRLHRKISRAQNAPDESSGQQTKRILGIIPNFRAVSADQKLPPETVKEKFIDCTEDSFDYSAIFIPAVIAGYNMDKRATPEFHQGAAGYARYFWHSAVDQTSENYMVEFIFPTITREDSRYYTLGHGGFIKRTGYALSRAVITRSNSGREIFNVSEVCRRRRCIGNFESLLPFCLDAPLETQHLSGEKTSGLTHCPSGSRSSGPTSTAVSFTTSTPSLPRNRSP